MKNDKYILGAIHNTIKDIDGLVKSSNQEDEVLLHLQNYVSPLHKKISSFFDGLAPFSFEYRQKVSELHELLLPGAYQYESEGFHNLQIDEEVRWGWPYCTRDANIVGDFLCTYAQSIKHLGLKKGASILEVGFGFGAFTCILSQTGYRVDALEVNKEQCEIVRRKVQSLFFKPNIIHSDCETYIDRTRKKYDAVIFFGCLHHIMNHYEVLCKIVENNLNKDGKILLANEPTVNEENNILPYSWGLRLDGESLRAVCKWGWLELGFTQNYLTKLFESLHYGLRFYSPLENVPMSAMMLAFPLPSAKSQQCDALPAYEFNAHILVSNYIFDSTGVVLSDIVVTNTGYGSWKVDEEGVKLGWRALASDGFTVAEGRINLPQNEVLYQEHVIIPQHTIVITQIKELQFQVLWEHWQWFGEKFVIDLSEE